MCKPALLAHHHDMSPGIRVLLAVSLAGCAGHRIVPPPPMPTDATPYQILVARARSGDTLIDFTALRRMYSQMAWGAPLASWGTLVTHARQAPDNAGARAAIDSALDLYYGSVRAHEIAESILRTRGDRQDAATEEALVRGFVRSIAVGGGTSTDSAFSVYSIQEEYAVMRARHLRVTRQALLKGKGQYSYDALTGVDSAGRSVTYYFRLLNGL
jgi:hypothetical protein